MSDRENDLLFTAIDPFGYPVSLRTRRYYEHIASSDNNHQPHVEFTPEEMKQAIEKPNFIYESLRPDCDVYFSKTCSKFPYMFIKIAVSKYPGCGDVNSAFLVPTVKGGIKEGGLKYANYKSEVR